MRPLAAIIAIPALGAVLAGGTPVAWADPATTEPAATNAAKAVRYTPYSKFETKDDGTVRATISPIPAYTRYGGGGWRAVDNDITTNPDAPDEDAYATPGGYRPLSFGRNVASLARLHLDGGVVRLTAPDLSSSHGERLGNSIRYAGVATDADLTLSPAGAGFRTVLRLNSSKAPTSYTLHLSDPKHLLGTASRRDDGGYTFSTEIEPGVQFHLEPATAYVVNTAHPDWPVGVDPNSATLSVTARGDGYDLVETVDPTWLAGKAFPIELDPLASLGGSVSDSRTCHIVDGPVHAQNYCTNSETVEVGYGPGTGTTWSLRRSLAYFDVSSIPVGARVDSASLNMYLYQNPQNTTLNISAYQASQPWTRDMTWDKRDADSSHTWSPEPGGAVGQALSTAQVGGTSGPGYGTGIFYPWNVSGLTQSWIAGIVPNNGLVLKANPEPGAGNGNVVMRLASQQATNSAMWPKLVVDYAERPQAPLNVRATEGDHSSDVSWDAPANSTNAEVTGNVVRAYRASSPTIAEQTVPCSSSCTVGSLVNGVPYVFGVTAVNGYRDQDNLEGRTPSGVTYTPYGKPPRPTALSVSTGAAPGAASLSWDPAGTNGRAVTSYTAYAYLAGSQSVVQAQTCDAQCATQQRPQVTFTNLTNGQPYEFNVTATAPAADQSRVTSDPSARVSGTPYASPGAPQITGTSRGDHEVSFTWTQPPAPAGAAPITGYTTTLFVAQSGTEVARDNAMVATARSKTFNDSSVVINGTDYRVCVAARFLAGTSTIDGTPVCQAPVKPARVPDSPAQVNTSADGEELTVTWAPPAFNGGEPVDKYEATVYRASDGAKVSGPTVFDPAVAPAADKATFGGLQPGVDYYAKVRAHNVIDWGAVAQSVSTRMPLPVAVAKSVLGAAKSVYEAGDVVSYQLVLNNPNAAAVNVKIEDVADSGIAFLPATLPAASLLCADAAAPCEHKPGPGQTVAAFTVPLSPD